MKICTMICLRETRKLTKSRRKNMNICMTTSRTSTNNCVKRVKVYGMKMKKAMVVVKELHHKMTKMILTFDLRKFSSVDI